VVTDPYSEEFSSYTPQLEVEHNTVIFATLLTAIGLFSLGLIYLSIWDWNEQMEVSKVKAKKRVESRTVLAFFNELIPEEFRPGPWKQLLMKRIVLEHSWFSAFGPYHGKKGFRLSKWVVAMGKLFTYILVSTIIAAFMFADNNFCKRYDSEDTCVHRRSLADVLQSCTWNDVNKTCVFNRPGIVFSTVVLFVTAVAMIAVPLANTIEIMIKRVFKLASIHLGVIATDLSGAQDKVASGESDFKEYWQMNDELQDVQSKQSKYFRAARFRKIQIRTDFSLPSAEVERLCSSADLYFSDYGRRLLSVNADQRSGMLHSDTVSHSRYSVYATSKSEVLSKVELVRKRAEYVKSELEYLPSQNEKELFLMKHFIVDAFKGYQRGIAARYFLGSIKSVRTSKYIELAKNCSLLLLPIIFAVLFYFVLFLNFDVGSRATDMWLCVTLVSLGEDIFVLQPLRIWLKWVVMNSYVSSEAFKICVALKMRYSSIINRKYGVMNDADAMIQHFNPACRAARLFPSLPVSRFLMSVNDYDMPKFKVEHTDTMTVGLKQSFSSLMSLLGSSAFNLFTTLPYFVQDSAIDVLGTLLINLLAIGFYFLGRAVMGLAITLVILLFAAIWARETDLLSKLEKRKVMSNVQSYIAPPPVKITPMAVVEKMDNDFDSKFLYNGRFRSVDATEDLMGGIMSMEDIETSSNGSMSRSKRAVKSITDNSKSKLNKSSPTLTNKSSPTLRQLSTDYRQRKNSSPSIDIEANGSITSSSPYQNSSMKSKKRRSSRRKDERSIGEESIGESYTDDGESVADGRNATLTTTSKSRRGHRKERGEEKESAEDERRNGPFSSQVFIDGTSEYETQSLQQVSPSASIKSVQSHFPAWH